MLNVLRSLADRIVRTQRGQQVPAFEERVGLCGKQCQGIPGVPEIGALRPAPIDRRYAAGRHGKALSLWLLFDRRSQ